MRDYAQISVNSLLLEERWVKKFTSVGQTSFSGNNRCSLCNVSKSNLNPLYHGESTDFSDVRDIQDPGNYKCIKYNLTVVI